MREYRSMIIALIAVASAATCVMILTSGLVDYKKSAGGSGITTTGSTDCNFESDLIVWRGDFSVRGNTPREAYSVIKKDAGLVKKYLEDNQASEDEMVSSSTNISQKYTSRYGGEGKYPGDEPNGYELTQTMTVSSYDIDKVEAISRDISALTEAGVELGSNQPEYYYTKLDKMKLDLTEKATASAGEWVGIMASGTGGTPGTLFSADLEVFQITARNSDFESYSYDGALDTSSRLKTAVITVRLNCSAQ